MNEIPQTRETAAPRFSAGTWRDAAIIAALFAAVLFIYLPVRDYQFLTFDDPGYIFDNGHVNGGLTIGNVKWAFTATTQNNWQPLVWLSYMFDVSVFKAGHPGAHHLMNVAMHLASTILLFLVLKRMTRQAWPSAFVAALFAVHPLHVESVAWIAERKDVLSTMFWMLTMGAYAGYVERPGLGRYLAVFVFLGLGLISKPMLVTLPFVLLLLDFWPLRRFGWSRLQGERLELETDAPQARPVASGARFVFVEKLPLLGLAAASSVITYVVQRACGAMEFGQTLTHWQRISSAIMAYATYIFKTVWPTQMAAIYPYVLEWPARQVAAAACGLGLATVAAVLLARRMPFLVIGWLWFLGTLVPVIGIVQVGVQSMADRYTYVPLTGLFIAVAFLAAHLASKRSWARAVAGLAGAGAVIAMTFVAAGQVKHWRDSESLFRQAATIDDNYVAHNNLAAALLAKQPMPPDLLAEALEHARAAARQKPDYADAHCNVGLALARSGDPNGAIESYLKAIRCRPDHSIARINLAAALIGAGRFQEAAAECAEVVRRDPSMQGAQENWAIALQSLGKPAEAAGHYEAAIAARPGNPDTRVNYAICCAALGRPRKAIEQFRIAVSIQPGRAQALNGLAWILATDPDPTIRNGREAVQFAERVVRITGGADATALDTLAAAYAEAGRFGEAVATAREAEQVAIAGNQQPRLQDVRQRLELYRAGKPYHTGSQP